MASPKLLFTAILILTVALRACSGGEIQGEEGSECNFKGTCNSGVECIEICGDSAALCVPGLHNDHRCCCLQHEGPPPSGSNI